MGRERFSPDRGRVVVDDGLAGGGIETRGDLGEPNFKKIGELRHRTYGRAGRFDGVGLLDRDGWADVFDGVDFGFVEEIEKLAGVRRKRFDVAALTLGVERVENE